ncbi:MAG TPA: aspartyl protease family protein [Candidatus Sulfotelmatobacter sp.]|nr:aspartyl protease family protein [Candidatus Sulfotelmatobacter sp.]
MRIVLAIGLAILSANSVFADTRIWLENPRINGKPVDMAFDSGAPTALLISKAVKRLGLKVTVPQTKNPGDTSVYAVDFQGHQIQTDFAISDFTPGVAPDFDGLLGWGPLSSNILRIDSAALQLTFLSKVPGAVQGWTKLFLDTNSSTLDLEIPGQNTISIDTGSPDGIELPRREWKRWKETHPRSPVTLVARWGMGGVYVSEESWADEYQIGPLIFIDVPLMEECLWEVNNLGPHHDLVGLAALRRLDLVVDGSHNVAYLRMRQTPPPYYSYNRLGAVFIPEARHHNHLVAHVAPGSPAYESGVRDGDILLSADNQISSDGYSSPAGTTVRLKLQRHRKTIEATATFRDILPISHRSYPSQDYSIGDPQFDAETYYGQAMLKLDREETNAALASCAKAIEIDPEFAHAYYFRAYLEHCNQNLDGAISDYSKAISLGIRSATAYADRGLAEYSKGLAEHGKGDLTAALADFSKAIELKPDWADVYGYRGGIEQTNGDLAGARADYSKVIALMPAWAPGYYGYRAQVEQRQGDLADAEADSAQAAKLDSSLATNSASEFVALGYLRYERQEISNALSDFRKAGELNHADGQAFLGVWLCNSRLGKVQTANTELRNWLSGGAAENTNDWTCEVARFLAGQLSEADFLNAAKADGKKDEERYCEAYYYIGAKRLIARDKAGAAAEFRKCLATGVQNFNEYRFAQAELQMLNASN